MESLKSKAELTTEETQQLKRVNIKNTYPSTFKFVLLKIIFFHFFIFSELWNSLALKVSNGITCQGNLVFHFSLECMFFKQFQINM